MQQVNAISAGSLLIAVTVLASAGAGWAQPQALYNCVCVCAIDPQGKFCGTAQDCFYHPDPIEPYASPACSDPTLGECVHRGIGCGRVPLAAAFQAPACVDEAALLTCMSYVDLNPIRAGMAGSLEESDFTSIQQRLQEVAEERRQAEEKAGVGIVVTAQGSRRPDLFAFARPEEIETEDMLPVGFGQYVELLAATGVMVRGGNQGGELPERSRTLLSKLGIDGQRWVETVVNYHRHFFSMVGHVHQIAIYCARTERDQAKGTAWAAKVFRDSA